MHRSRSNSSEHESLRPLILETGKRPIIGLSNTGPTFIRSSKGNSAASPASPAGGPTPPGGSHTRLNLGSTSRSILSPDRKVVMFGAPINTGAEYTGSDTMLTTIREAGLEQTIRSNGWALEDMGDLNLMELLGHYGDPTKDEENIMNSYAIGRTLEKVCDTAYQASLRGAFVLTVGGDRSISSATISGIMKARRDLSVIFVSAYGDCNTPETSPSREYHGMTAAHVLGWFRNQQVKGFEWMKTYLPEHRCAFIGLRDIDAEEVVQMRESGLRIYSMFEVDHMGIGAVMEMAIHSINPHNNRPVHISLDLSGVNMPGMKDDDEGFQDEGGLTIREAHFILQYLSRTGLLGSMDIIQMSPEGNHHQDGLVSPRMRNSPNQKRFQGRPSGGDPQQDEWMRDVLLTPKKVRPNRVDNSLQAIRTTLGLISSAIGKKIL